MNLNNAFIVFGKYSMKLFHEEIVWVFFARPCPERKFWYCHQFQVIAILYRITGERYCFRLFDIIKM